MPARSTATIKKKHWKVMHRTPAAFAIPADAAEQTALEGTMSELGYCEDNTIKITLEASEKVVLDDGSKLAQGFNGTVEGTLLQSSAADYTAYESIEAIAQDLYLLSADGGQAVFFPNAILNFNENVESGGIERIPWVYEIEDAASKAAIRTRYDVPV